MQKLRTRYEPGALGPPLALKKLRNEIKKDAALFPDLLTEFNKEYGLLFEGDAIKVANAKYIDDALVDKAYNQFNALYFEFLDKAESGGESEVERLRRQLREQEEKYARLQELAAQQANLGEIDVALILKAWQSDGHELNDQQKEFVETHTAKLKQIMAEHKAMNDELLRVKSLLEQCEDYSKEEGIVKCRVDSNEQQQVIARQSAEIVDLKEKVNTDVGELRNELRRVQSQHADEVAQLKIAQTRKLRIAEAEAEQLRKKNAALVDQLDAASTASADAQSALQQVTGEVVRLNSANQGMAARIETLTAQVEQTQKDLGELTASMSVPNFGDPYLTEPLYERITQLQNELAAKNDENAQLVKQLEEAREIVTESELGLSVCTREKEQYEALAKVAKAAERQASDDMQTAIDEYQRIERMLTAANTEKQSLEHRVATLDETVRENVQEIDNQRSRITSLTQELDKLQLLNAVELQSKVELLERQRATMQSQLNFSDVEKARLQEDIHLAEIRIKELVEISAGNVDVKRENLVDNIVDTQQQFDTSNLAELTKLHRQVVALETELNELRPLLEMDYVGYTLERIKELVSGGVQIVPAKLRKLVNTRDFDVDRYIIIPKSSYLGMMDYVLEGNAAKKEVKARAEGLSLGQSVARYAYESLARQPLNGTHRLRLAFHDANDRRRLEIIANDLAPRVLNEGAAPEMVANIGLRGRALDYAYVGPLERDLIPATGSLTWRHYDGALLRAETTEAYTLTVPPTETPYGAAATHEFSDGTRLYATYVTASLYSVNMIVTPFRAVPVVEVDDSDSETEII